MFSVIMPYYKNISVVRRSIKSVLCQKKDLELIIVDDGSNDSICELVRKIGDTRIKLFQQNNQGVSSARNNAIRRSTGEWICFLDSDDEWTSDHLDEISRMQELYPKDLFFVTSHMRDGKKEYFSNTLLKDEKEDIIALDDLLRYSLKRPGIIHTNSVCIHRSLIEDCGCFCEGVNKGEDTDLWYKCSMYSRVILSKKTTSIYHRANSFLTKKKEFNYDWIFLDNIEAILNDERISDNKKYSAKLFCQNYQLSICKRLIADGKKKLAVQNYNELSSDLCKELQNEYRRVGKILKCPQCISYIVLNTMYYLKERKY